VLAHRGLTDSEIFDFAEANGWIISRTIWILVSCSRPWRANGPSVVQVRCQDVLPSAIGDIVLRAIRTAERHLESGAPVTVDSLRYRRLLPI